MYETYMRPGNLTKGACLYEGIFPEWCKQVSAVARLCGVDAFCGRSETYIHGSKAEAHDLCLRIRHLVSAHMLQRVPNYRNLGFTDLLGSLQDLTRPFRLKDMRPKLRSRIYGHAVDLSTTFCNANSEDYGVTPPPPIMQVPRLTRSEAAPVFYKSTPIFFDYDLGAHARLVDGVSEFVEACDTLGNLRDMRHARVGSTDGDLAPY